MAADARASTLLATLLALCLTYHAGAAQSYPRITSTPSCPACAIQFDEVTRLGTYDGEGTVSDQSRVTRSGDGRYFVVSNREPGIVKVYAPSGSFVQQIGRLGSGPNEYRRPWFVMPTDDGIYIIDVVLNRISR